MTEKEFHERLVPMIADLFPGAKASMKYEASGAVLWRMFGRYPVSVVEEEVATHRQASTLTNPKFAVILEAVQIRLSENRDGPKFDDLPEEKQWLKLMRRHKPHECQNKSDDDLIAARYRTDASYRNEIDARRASAERTAAMMERFRSGELDSGNDFEKATARILRRLT